jgi:hypothetical protein
MADMKMTLSHVCKKDEIWMMWRVDVRLKKNTDSMHSFPLNVTVSYNYVTSNNAYQAGR